MAVGVFAVLAIAFSLSLLAPADATAGPSPPVEVWTGTLDTGSGSLRLELHVTGTGEERRVELISVDQGGARLPVDEFSIEDGVMTFAIDQIGAHFRGTLGDEGTVAEGTWTRGGIRSR